MPLNQDLGLVENTLTGETDLTMGQVSYVQNSMMERDVSINNLNLDRPEPLKLN